MAMNPEIKAKWVAALRSGEYKQGEGYLRQDNCFCCLGVLCDLVSANEWEQQLDSNIYSWRVDGATDLPPDSLRHEVGLSWTTLKVTIDGRTETLYNHNDQGRTFSEIADAIEAQL